MLQTKHTGPTYPTNIAIATHANEKGSLMLRIALALIVVLAMSTIPRLADAKARHATYGNQNYTVSLQVSPDCSLSLMTTGTVSFPPISGLGSSSESTENNPATIYCEAASATMNVYDGNPQNDPTYKLTYDHSHSVIPFKVCRDTYGYSCFNNSTSQSLGYPLGYNLHDQKIVVPLIGFLTGQGRNQPDTYTDMLTVALTFS